MVFDVNESTATTIDRLDRSQMCSPLDVDLLNCASPFKARTLASEAYLDLAVHEPAEPGPRWTAPPALVRRPSNRQLLHLSPTDLSFQSGLSSVVKSGEICLNSRQDRVG